MTFALSCLTFLNKPFPSKALDSACFGIPERIHQPVLSIVNYKIENTFCLHALLGRVAAGEWERCVAIGLQTCAPFQDPAVMQHQPSTDYATLDVYNPFDNRGLLSSAVRQNNWPPLPSFCPVKPCFYQDISVEIPADFQKTVSSMYYLWMASTVTLFLNFLASLAWFCVDSTAGSGFGLSILWVLLFTPCSFLCWYRPMYKAFRSDSSFNFFVFFFIFFVQDVVYVLQAIGIPGSGFSGWIASLTVLRSNQAAAAIMLLVAVFFTVVAVLGIFMLKRIHSLYRRTGASFQKAQEEVAAGVFSNQAGPVVSQA
nr:secretory carrier-associated membrane protein 3 [Pelodiscus sinensis]|eukprot:XP_025042684.1 secretory carrier-associated membrane protein 3 [Pelodiscus sinensis]